MRNVQFTAFVGVGLLLCAAALINGTGKNTPTFSALFEVAGKVPQAVDQAVGQMLPLTEEDETEMGNQLRSHYEKIYQNPSQIPAQNYVRALLKNMEGFKKKSFNYISFVIPGSQPNAMALPGGVILVTEGLLQSLKSEAELVGVLGHEMGHIELSHCFEAVKFKLLAEKTGMELPGALAALTRNLLVAHSFQKTQEDDADAYAFSLILSSTYDPKSIGDAFLRLESSHSSQYDSSINPFRDYFSSHPPLDNRKTQYYEKARDWWSNHVGESRYRGEVNLRQYKTRLEQDGGAAEIVTSYKE